MTEDLLGMLAGLVALVIAALVDRSRPDWKGVTP